MPRLMSRAGLILAVVAVLVVGVPSASFGHGHTGNYCGPDRLRVAALDRLLGTPAAYADTFTIVDERPACGFPEKVTQYVNNTSLPQTQSVSYNRSFTTTYSVSGKATAQAGLPGAFAAAFETTLGYAAETAAGEQLTTSITVPPGKTVELLAAPSLWIIEGVLSESFFKKTNIVTFRPSNDDLIWIAQEVDYATAPPAPPR